MRRTTRMAAMTGASLVAVGSLLAGVAGADTAGQYQGKAEAEALHLRLAGTDITLSSATAAVDGTPHHAKAQTGEALVGTLASGGAVAEQPGGKAEQADDCKGGPNLASLRDAVAGVPGVARLDITCGKAIAGTTADGSHATAMGAQLVVEPSVSEVLSTLQIGDTASQTASQLSAAINPLVQGLTGNPVGDLVSDANTTLQEVVSKVLTLKSTARVVVGPAYADTVATASSVTSTACAQGVRVELLPVDVTGATNGLLPEDLKAGEPIVTITIGSAYGSKTSSRQGANGEGKAAAAPVIIHFATTALAESLGLSDVVVGHTSNGDGATVPSSDRCSVAAPGASAGAPTTVGGADIVVPVGAEQCLLQGTPLEVCVKVAAASVDAAGNATADGVSLSLFAGQASLTTGKASAGGTTETPIGAPGSAPAPAQSLPRTGGNGQLAVIGLALAAAAVVVRRIALA